MPKLLSIAIAMSLITTICIPAQVLAKQKSTVRNKSSNTYLRLTYKYKGRTNKQGNPVYTLEAYTNGRKYRAFKAVTGTRNTQGRNRNRANSHAPLPDGLYKVSRTIAPGSIPEVGRTFVPIYPQFSTGRSDLGIHFDPSYNRSNGFDGTSGCIGLVDRADRDALNQYILKYQPRKLIVRIMS